MSVGIIIADTPPVLGKHAKTQRPYFDRVIQACPQAILFRNLAKMIALPLRQHDLPISALCGNLLLHHDTGCGCPPVSWNTFLAGDIVVPGRNREQPNLIAMGEKASGSR